MFDLTVFGDPVLDHIYSLDDPFHIGGKMLGQYGGCFPGGTITNVASASARLGMKSHVIGRVARGKDYPFHRNSLAFHNVDTTGLIEVTTDRGAHTVIAIAPDGEKTLIYVPIEAEKIPTSIIIDALAKTHFAYVMAADFDLISAHCASTSARICVDVDAAAGLSTQQFEQISEKADILFINDVGCKKLTGENPSPELVSHLLGPRANILCCTGGAGTTFLSVRKESGIEILTRSALPTNVIDTTGAGDCFNAAFLSELFAGKPADLALDFAMAAGALATETFGARDAIPDKQAIMQRLECAHLERQYLEGGQ